MSYGSEGYGYGEGGESSYGSKYGSNYGNNGNKKLYGYGSSDLPQDIANQLTESEKMNVKYWSRTDDSQPICRSMFCDTFGPLLMLPCFWPHMLIIGPCAACVTFCSTRGMKNSAVVLTSNTIENISLPFEVCCIPGIYKKSGSKVTTAASSVYGCTVDKKDSGCLTSCNPDVGKLQVHGMGMEGLSSKGGGGYFIGHSNVDELREQIIKLNGYVGNSDGSPMGDFFGKMSKGIQLQQVSGHNPATVVPMATSSDDPVAKLEKLMEMKNKGLITETEYSTMRAAVLGM